MAGAFHDRAEAGRVHAVGAWYEDFSQTTDGEVRGLLARASVGRERKD